MKAFISGFLGFECKNGLKISIIKKSYILQSKRMDG